MHETFTRFNAIHSLHCKGRPILTWSKAGWCIVLDNMQSCIENCCIIICRLQH